MDRTMIEGEYLSVEEYLRREEVAEVRHEYVGGTIHALAGATKRHNVIATNILFGLRDAARRDDCRVYVLDVKLRVSDEVTYYPDVMVACGPMGDDPLIEDAPCLVVEVTSPSTEAIDRREKLLMYRRIPTLRAYLVVDQAMRAVDRHWSDEAGAWQHERVEGEGEVQVPCPETVLTLDGVYQGSGVGR